MATQPQTKKTVKSKIVSSPNKRFNLSKKQWGIIGVVAIILVVLGAYLGIQQYQTTTANAAGWTTVGTNNIGVKKKSYGTVKIYACKKTKGSGYTVTAKQVTTGLYGDRNAATKGAIFFIWDSSGKDLTGTEKTSKALGSVGTSRSITTKSTLKSAAYIVIYSISDGFEDKDYYQSQGWQYKVSSLKSC